MAKKVTQEMASRVTIDTVGAVKSYKALTEAVKASTSSWKAEEVALKSAGNYQEASKAKMEGLTKSIELQKSKIAELKSRQEGLDRSTKDGQEAFFKLDDQISKATRSMGSMEGQLTRSKSSFHYYNSGLADLQKGYRSATTLSKSYVERLEAEGKTAEASKVKLSGYKQGVTNLSSQLKLQQSELARVASESGKTSEAYRKQQVRVNETATSLAKAKTQMGELDGAMRKANATPFTRMLDSAKSKLGLVRKEEDKTKESTKHFALGTAIGTAITAGASSAIGYLKGVTSEGYKLAEAGGTIKKQWQNLGLSDKEATKMTAQIGDIRSKANMSGGAIDQMQKKFYAMTNSTSKARAMTEVIASYGSAAGKSGDQIAQMSQGIGKLSGSAKVTASLFKRSFSQVPELQKAIIKASGMSTKAFNDALNGGKITGTQLQNYMVKASKTSGKAWSEFGETTKGKLASIQGTYTNLKVAFAKPLVSGVETAIDGVSKKKGAIDGVKASLTKMVGVLGEKTGQYVGNVISFLVKNEKPIEKMGGALASITGELVKGAWSMIASTLKLIGGHSRDAYKGLNGVADATQGIAKHKGAIQTIGKVLVTSFAISKLKGMASGLLSIGSGVSKTIGFMKSLSSAQRAAAKATDTQTTAQKLLDIAMNANPIALVVTAVVGLGVAFYEAYKHIKPFRDAVNGLGKSMKKLFTGKYGWEKAIGKKLASVGNTISKWGKGAGKFVGKHKKEILAGLTSPFAGLAMWFLKDTKTGKAVTKWSKGFAKDVGKMGLKKATDKQVKEAGKSFNKSKFGKWYNNISSSFNSWKKSFSKNWSKHWNSMTKSLNTNWNNSLKATKKFFSQVGSKWNSWKKSFSKDWGKHWKSTTSTLQSNWNNSLKNTKKFFSQFGSKWDSWKKSFAKSWSKHWNSVKNNLADNWNKAKKNTASFFSSMGSKWAGWKKSFSKSWNNHWSTMTNNLHSNWNKSLKNTRSFGSSMSGWLGGFKKSFSKGFSSLGSGVKNIFSSMWSSLKKSAQNGMNGTIDIINGGIGAVNGAIHSFGGKKSTISKLGHVKLATGTGMFSGERKPITKPTLALLNDGNDSPETGNKEALIHSDGTGGIIQGRNVTGLLKPGDEVLNASELKMLMGMQGITHYAKGTGFFGSVMSSVSSGIGGAVDWVTKKVKGLENFFKTAENVIAHPVKSLESLFGWENGKTSGAMTNLGKGMFDSTNKQLKTWWSTLWSAVSDKLDDGDGGSSSELVNKMEKYGATNKYIYGAEGPTAFDCSGLVEYTLKKMGISFPRTSGEQYRATKHVSNPKPGDLVFFGPGGSEHVGVYTGGGNFYSAQNEHDGMGISKVHGGGFGSFAGYGRVPGLHDDATPKDSGKKDSGLTGMIKNQVGGGFWKFISKLADEFGDGESSNPGGSGVQRWKPDVIKALKKNGFEATASQVSAWMRVIARESNGDPHAQNNWDSNAKKGIPSKGLVQTIEPTFNAYKFPGHGNIFNGYDDLLAGIHYMKAIYGSGPSAFARVSGPEGYKNGGIVRTNRLIEVAEQNRPEMIVPLTNKSRAGELIGQAVAHLVSGQQTTVTDNVKDNEKLDKVIALLTALVAGQGNVQAIVAKNDVYNAVKTTEQTKNQYQQMLYGN